MPEGDKTNDWFLWSIGISCLAVIVCTFYLFYLNKDYNFIVEIACDPAIETCFQRDCSNPDDCPPNELSNFKRYGVSANDFKKCENEDCAEICLTGTIQCEPVECTENLDAGESCTASQTSSNNN